MIGGIKEILFKTGSIAIGTSRAAEVDEQHLQVFESWLERGENAEMRYMENHKAIRRDPRLLLDGAKTVISLAFSFMPPAFRETDKGMIACYAYGNDYHEVIRKQLDWAVKEIKEIYGGEYRICIDSAPIMERYWAEKSGIGRIGKNGSLIVPGYGSMVFLSEIITTLELPEKVFISTAGRIYQEKTESEKERFCMKCGKCLHSCPGGALNESGGVDARRCLSYLTIEHRGEWDTPEALDVINTPAGKKCIFGCDICLRSCPLNRHLPPTDMEEFLPRPEIFNFNPAKTEEMTQEEFSKIFKQSPVKRAKLAGLKRNSRFFYKNS